MFNFFNYFRLLTYSANFVSAQKCSETGYYSVMIKYGFSHTYACVGYTIGLNNGPTTEFF